jgi:uncharacterized protein (TIGR02246 family)
MTRCWFGFLSGVLLLLIQRGELAEKLYDPGILHAAQASETKPTKAPAESKQPGPESTVKNIVLAWNRGDDRAIAALFLTDGVLVTPNGSVVQSRGEIQKTIAKERQGRLKDTILKNTVDDVSLEDANTAIVKGTYQLDGMKIVGVKTSPEGSYTLRQKRQQGRWMIARAEIQRKKAE